MQKQLKKNIISKPTDFLPIRTKETVAVTYSGDTVTNIEQVFPDGRRVDLDGEVQGNVGLTITENNPLQEITPGAGYTAMKKVTLNVNVPTGESIGVVTLNMGLPSTYPDEWNTTEPFSDPKPCKYLYNDTYHYGQLCYSPLRGGIQTLHLFTPDHVDRFTRSVSGAVGGWDIAAPWQ